MLRLRSVFIALTLAACSNPKAPAPEEARVSQDPAAMHESGQAALPPPDPREKALAGIVLQLFEEEHLLRKPINDEISRLAFTAYLDAVDGGKMFLLRSDKEALARFTDKIDDQLRSGQLDLAHEGAKTFAARVSVVEKMVAELLAAPMDFSNEEFTELDAKKLELVATDAELKDRWRQRLELEVLDRVATMEQRLKPKDPKAPKDEDEEAEEKTAPPVSTIPTTPEGREAKARSDLAKTYSGRFARLRTPGPLDAASEMVNAVASALDPHTTYLPPADKANFDIRMSGSLEGIGAVLREKDHLIEIVELVPGGASWRQGGLAQGDLILSVQQDKQDPIDVFDMRIDEVVKMIRGPKGTIVRLRVQKPAGTEETIAITRDVVVIEESYARGAILQAKGKPTVGYIHLPSFYGGKGASRSAAGDIKKLLGEMKAKKVTGVVLDIRSNGGGLLGDAIEITGQLIDRGPVVQVKDSDGQKEVLADTRKGIEYDGPVIVLVDRFSASASEILAGALQDYGRALIVGTGPTHGKGTVQTIADLDRATGGKIELGVLKITIQQFFRPSGSSMQREGVTPDVILPDPAGHVDSGERELDHAIAWSQISPAPFDKWTPFWKTKSLAEKSSARVTKHAVLAKIATATQLLRSRRTDTKVPLARTAWEKRRTEQKAALEAASPDLKKAPPAFTVKPLDESAVPVIAPGPGGKTDDRPAKWRDGLARDPWVEECVHILADMTAK